MSKTLKKSNLDGRSPVRMTVRTLLAVSLCASIAAFGCTTDRTVGNGDPVVTPGLRNSPTGGASTGTETESVPPPMMSSYSGAGPLPAVRPRVSREEAALLLVEMQPRVKVLGKVAPGPSRLVSASDRVAINMQQVEGRSTVNSTIYSAPVEGIISGAGEGLASGNVVSPGTVTTSTPVTSADGAVIAPTSAATVTPTGSAIANPSALASVRTLSPTASAVVNPPASISSSPALATVSSARTAGTVTRSTPLTSGGVSTQSTATQSTTTQSVSATAVPVVNPVRVVTTNGRVTVTNVTTTSRQQ